MRGEGGGSGGLLTAAAHWRMNELITVGSFRSLLNRRVAPGRIYSSQRQQAVRRVGGNTTTAAAENTSMLRC